jgi:hypothetical protein
MEVLRLTFGIGAVERVQQLRLRQLLRVVILGGQRLMRGEPAAIVRCSSTAVSAATPHSGLIS